MINRRQALMLTGAFAALGATAKFASAEPQPEIAPAAHDLYARAIVFDANLAPPLPDGFPFPKEMLDMARDSGVTAVKTTLGGINLNFEDTIGQIAFFQRIFETHPDVFMQVREHADFAKAKRDKRFGVLLSFESVEMLEGKLDRISLFRNLGVRVMQLSYNKVSPFASGVLADPPSGLTDLGRKAVETMNKEGVAIDIVTPTLQRRSTCWPRPHVRRSSPTQDAAPCTSIRAIRTTKFCARSP